MNYPILCLLLFISLPSSLAVSNEFPCPELENADDDIPVPHKSAEDFVNNCTSSSKSENVVKVQNVNVRAKRQDDQPTPDVDENSGKNIDPPPGSSSSEDHTSSPTCTDVGTWTGWKLLAILFIGLCILFLCSTIGLAFMHFGRRGK